ncbi:hypothetical protein VCHC46A1_2230 [Vibrio cholerae HC-46A1]|nr:hypothetical protein VCHCUF01_1591 [Vibrio cholerae HCUF01]EHH99473.1 hypothetical protein VCHC43A1_1558 [Vibrio cholerae HC-43A1]EJH32088.1 hypothetical protein VCCP10325_1486 [Vibrio cholerae CP1032(5)]EJH39028.1 hypothetical protein VCCP104215_2498 [Vibrio cholerae CP1042(15)]EJH42062.1 hypothetical protein VCCP104619_2393 [Vibrio cholerae CP1046(19)]EJH55999.1 hypothetical protein VCHC46A1_2230 [Vibrio cholerae HC-46A1]CSC37050.1 Uncharacterised protein [Vibrio cholerae]
MDSWDKSHSPNVAMFACLHSTFQRPEWSSGRIFLWLT